MISAIEDRRSIRKYKNTDIPRHMTEEIIRSGILAPSSKNRQPWKFIVTTGKGKREGLAAMRMGLEREKTDPLLPDSAGYLSWAYETLHIMEQAPVIIYIVNTLGADIQATLNQGERISELCNSQSIGAAIENMTLAATELGLGSLWICDTYFAHRELNDWLDAGGELLAALAVGYADENPSARPRKSFHDVVEWRE